MCYGTPRGCEPGFAGKRADEITTDHVNDYAEARLEEGAANATVNRELAFLRLAFNLARKAGKLKPESVPYFEMLPENNRRTGFFEQEQYEAVLGKLPDYLKGVLTMGILRVVQRHNILQSSIGICFFNVRNRSKTSLAGRAWCFKSSASAMAFWRYLRRAWTALESE